MSEKDERRKAMAEALKMGTNTLAHALYNIVLEHWQIADRAGEVGSVARRNAHEAGRARSIADIMTALGLAADIGPPFARAWTAVCDLIGKKAKHRTGFDISEATPDFILSQLQQELNELKEDPDNPEEMADVLGIIVHYCVKMVTLASDNPNAWTLTEIEKKMLAKFKRRFTLPMHPKTSAAVADIAELMEADGYYLDDTDKEDVAEILRRYYDHGA